MSLILSIDTAMETAGICLAENDNILVKKLNSQQMDHAAWIHSAIDELCRKSSKKISDLQAIAVSAGPGSYTGLRVGMATAKGLCFALNIPLITKNTLELSALAVKKDLKSVYALPILYCPMIDARRMEVFTALYDSEMREIMPPQAMILDENSFADQLEKNIIIFCGSGSSKWQNICISSNGEFSDKNYDVTDLALVAADKFGRQEFADIAYSEPLYVKNVYTGLK